MICEMCGMDTIYCTSVRGLWLHKSVPMSEVTFNKNITSSDYFLCVEGVCV